ncbi:MAG: tripartite tricarboxylate transporter substrate binding protein [Rubrivivax sp.]|nr:tripartite tricarboxylate transporter substrate binding protein [Rubrivivax sp.]
MPSNRSPADRPPPEAAAAARARRLALGLLAASAAGLASAPLLAQTGPYPNRPIKLIVPLGAGSTADIVSRYAGQELAKVLGQSVVIENKPAAGGTVAMGDLARAAPDGYTIGFASQGTLVFNQAIYSKPGYDSIKDFRPIAFVGGVSNVMIVPPASAAKAPADVVAEARSKPGQLTFSSGGAGTSHHLSGVLFARSTGTDLLHVPYKGAPQGILAVMSGEVAMGFFNTPTVISQIKDGKLKALGVTSLTRSPLLPQVPTLDEQGIKGYEVNTWFGFVGPAGMPDEIVTQLHAAFTKVLTSAEAKEKLGAQGFDLAPPSPPAAFSKVIADDLAKWVPIVKASGAKAD